MLFIYNYLKHFNIKCYSNVLKIVVLFTILFATADNANAQGLSVNSCPTIVKRSNGNGQALSAAGFFPGYAIDNPTAANVTNTKYDTVLFDPQTKTGNINFKWSSATTVTNLPVITRVW
ncbi:MAG: hypothetical protein ACK45U_08445, partial [bacterium]